MLERFIEGLMPWAAGMIEWLLQRLLELGYPGIIVLMALESSVLPVPAELVMPPAGYWVAKGEMNAVAAVASGVLGSLLGSLANYFLAMWLGRGFVRRFGKYFLISERSLERSERYFAAHGEISVLLGRMLPVVRHLISIPAGLARMSLPAFVTYTGLGALLWCSILTWIGYFIGQHEEVLRPKEVQHYVSRALLILLPVLALVVGIYVLRQRRRITPGEGG
jgi:membrane protein DedA with SNARE-associated domain